MVDDWNIEKIRKVLPQDIPFLFVDKVVDIDTDNKRVVCEKNVTINEPFFQGHFPSKPVMPGVLILESLAQASIILYAVLKPKIASMNPTYYLGRVEAKFLKPVMVGDVLRLEVKAYKVLDNAGVVEANAIVDDNVVVKARISFGIKVEKGE